MYVCIYIYIYIYIYITHKYNCIANSYSQLQHNIQSQNYLSTLFMYQYVAM